MNDSRVTKVVQDLGLLFEKNGYPSTNRSCLVLGRVKAVQESKFRFFRFPGIENYVKKKSLTQAQSNNTIKVKK
jgi:hypothetical protein